jgi:hypothetical protein
MGKSRGKPWENHGKMGKSMGKSENHGKIHGKNHGNGRII